MKLFNKITLVKKKQSILKSWFTLEFMRHNGMFHFSCLLGYSTSMHFMPIICSNYIQVQLVARRSCTNTMHAARLLCNTHWPKWQHLIKNASIHAFAYLLWIVCLHQNPKILFTAIHQLFPILFLLPYFYILNLQPQ